MGALAPIVVSATWEGRGYLFEKAALMRAGVGCDGGIR